MTIHASESSAWLRPASREDCAAIVGLIGELAAFENLSHLMEITPARLNLHLFGERPVIECVVVEQGGQLIAFALFFTNYSTFLGKPGLYLEDLYVQPAHRGCGVGKMLLLHLANLANARGCGRFEWSVLDWNAGAIGFYERMGATVMPDWRICRLAGEALAKYKA
jgi:GNAT superfamily N-acetyltransferase